MRRRGVEPLMPVGACGLQPRALPSMLPAQITLGRATVTLPLGFRVAAGFEPYLSEYRPAVLKPH